jgi:hypothetical protein
MGDRIRVLTTAGVAEFRSYIDTIRGGAIAEAPKTLLTAPEFSTDFADIEIQALIFADRFEFGTYLATTLGSLDRRTLSRNYGLWTWLALYYFDQLCPASADGVRRVFADETYILPAKYDYQSYYRHLVRTPWLAVSDHGDSAKVLLIPAGQSGSAPLARRGEIIEQLASRQAVLGNPRIIRAASKLYFDPVTNRPRRGTGGSKGGSPRRLALVLQQLDLTFDLVTCEEERLLTLLPKEFDRWRTAAA